MIFRKLTAGILYLFAITFAAFVLSLQMPGDPAEIIANLGRESEAPEAVVEQIRLEYGLEKPLMVQYGLWLKRVVLEGDLGRSMRTRLPVQSELAKRLPVTLQLAIWTFVSTLLISVPLGITAGVSRNPIWDGFVRGVSLLGYAFPVFLVGNLLLWLFSVHWHLFPMLGHDSWRHYVLPVTALSIHMIGWTTQLVRSSVKSAAGEYFVLVAKAKGLAKKQLVLRYILRPALLPVLTSFLILLGRLVSGSFIIEVIFGWNGVGRLLIDSILARDFPMIQGIVLYIGGVFAVLNLVIDSLYILLQPQVRQQMIEGQAR
jgi:ABC-type dipeptide/oligopeptide/nickel transport system permease component